jgi:hypothetical protein
MDELCVRFIGVNPTNLLFTYYKLYLQTNYPFLCSFCVYGEHTKKIQLPKICCNWRVTILNINLTSA